MNDLKHWKDILLESYSNLIDGLINTSPKVLTGLLLLLIGWLLARLFSGLISRSLKVVHFDKLMNRVQVGDFLKQMKIEKTPSQIVGKFIYWTIMLLIFVGFSEALELTVVSQKIGTLLNYIPNLIIAAIILIVGLYLASKLKDFIQMTLSSYAVQASRLVGNIIFYIITVFVVLTALEQLKFNIDLLTSNVMILLGGVALAFAIGYGLAAKDIFPNIISAYYTKGRLKVGQRIRIASTEGNIVEITNLAVVLQTNDGKRFIPAKKLITEEMEILKPV